MGEFMVLFLVSACGIWAALRVLEALFKAAIKAFKFLGSLAVAFIPAVVCVFISNALFDISMAQAAVQYTATNVVLAGIGVQMFGGASDKI